MANANYSDILHARFHDLLISYDFARSHNGFEFAEVDTFGAMSNQVERELLAVEQQAKSERDAVVATKNINQQEKSAELNQTVSNLVLEQLTDVTYVYNEILQIQDAVPALLDILSVRAASIVKLDPLVSTLPWLSADLIKFVNLPVYRKGEGGQKPIRVERSKTALSYIGLDNLKMVVPSFALRKWIPHSTEPFRLMKRKLWESGIGAGIACRKLAQLNDEDPDLAFTMGVFHDLGKSAVVRLYLRTFEQEWRRQLKAARDERLKVEHDALVNLEPDAETLRNLLLNHIGNLTADLIKEFNLKRLNVSTPIAEYANAKNITDLSPMAKILSKGVCYSRYKLLQRHGLIAKHEAKIFFKENHLSHQDIAELNKLNLTRLNLRLVQS